MFALTPNAVLPSLPLNRLTALAPPPPNQIIYVTSEDGIEVGGMFEPMWITGKLETASYSNELADVGYTMTLDGSEPYEY